MSGVSQYALPLAHHKHPSGRKDSALMERLQLIRLYRGLILMQMGEWVLGTVVMCVVVCIDCLRLQTSNSIKLFDGCRTQASQGTEHCPLDLCDLSIFHSIDQCVLRRRSMILQLLRCIFLAKRCDLVEIHFEIMRHFCGQIIFRGLLLSVGTNLHQDGNVGAESNCLVW